MRATGNLRVQGITMLASPNQIIGDLPLSDRAAAVVCQARDEIESAILGRDWRQLVVVGPCSIHDPEAALEYAERLLRLRERLRDQLIVVMRVYFEKPRTTVGWKGLINDPNIDGSYDIPRGLLTARKLLLDLAELGMPAATELLDPVVPQYIADLVSWAAIGARTTESQTHREMASGLSMPVGFKNGTDGGLTVAINAMIAAARAHSFLGVDADGRLVVVRTRGNPHTHLVLRGGSTGPNYQAHQVAAAAAALELAGLGPRVMVDASHDNSGKDPERQAEVVAEVGAQLRTGSQHLLGVMIESNLVGGRQELDRSNAELVYGKSITDACVDFSATVRMLEDLAEDVAARVPLSAIA
jgi:3-deoxy-7-phosphoheptulonate synthase